MASLRAIAHLLCVRWYCRYQLSYRDVEEMMRERGLDGDHSTVFRWVQRYAPEINKRVRQYLKVSGTSYRIDETYITVGKSCKYLYRAVDKECQTIEFMLSAKRVHLGWPPAQIFRVRILSLS